MAQRFVERSPKHWEDILAGVIGESECTTDLVGIGNRLRGDDAVGLEIASRLRAKLGPTPARRLRIHRESSEPERLLYKLAATSGRIVIFDAVDASVGAGEIVCTSLGDTKYGFFATHNIPLKIVPGLAERLDDVLLVGVQPESLEVGEGLSDVASAAAGRVVEAVTRAVEART